ncbi:MAG: hypothetical protein QT08_C0015G0031 [archaeon GW2011_AR17]|nr:MAG: hypothetical protein QT08_C0015G0031 [archaeon GW2011_AR17]MBS3154031.1 hypothetical protein [Candidatus Woesearchaeota archaeon]HIH15580.1 hypothetical protein [Nanoarchaeota archaeon]HIH59089.1 hypothetical protein [Nanoarchaeota archaeon]HII14623.1 hypothetical protein [Nanoarchaeota archaeon]
MILLLNGPYWFRGIDALFGLIYILVTLLIAAMSYKAYKMTEEKKYVYFAAAFGLMSLSFIVYSLINLALTTHISNTLSNILTNFDYGFLLHMLFMFAALTLLLVVTLKIEQKKVIILLFTLMLLFTAFSYQYYLKFHIVSFLLLFFLGHQFYTNYLEKKNFNAKLVFVSFYLLACAQVFFLAMVYFNPIFYVVGNILQLLGFVILFYMFVRVLNYGREKRKA